MATKNSFNISALYKQVFGITGVRFAIPAANNTTAARGSFDTDVQNNSLPAVVIPGAEYKAGIAVNEALNLKVNNPDQYSLSTIPLPSTSSIQSVLGTPIYEQITLSVPAVVVNGKPQTQAFTYTFPDWPLFDISPAWLIKKENIQGGNGSVKEFISQDDFSITIRGFLINNADQGYPDQLLSDLWKVINSKQSLGITSKVFTLLDIHNIVILSAKFPSVEGYMIMQPFELECISDTPAILQLQSKNISKPTIPGK